MPIIFLFIFALSIKIPTAHGLPVENEDNTTLTDLPEDVIQQISRSLSFKDIANLHASSPSINSNLDGTSNRHTQRLNITVSKLLVACRHHVRHVEILEQIVKNNITDLPIHIHDLASVFCYQSIFDHDTAVFGPKLQGLTVVDLRLPNRHAEHLDKLFRTIATKLRQNWSERFRRLSIIPLNRQLSIQDYDMMAVNLARFLDVLTIRFNDTQQFDDISFSHNRGRRLSNVLGPLMKLAVSQFVNSSSDSNSIDASPRRKTRFALTLRSCPRHPIPTTQHSKDLFHQLFSSVSRLDALDLTISDNTIFDGAGANANYACDYFIQDEIIQPLTERPSNLKELDLKYVYYHYYGLPRHHVFQLLCAPSLRSLNLSMPIMSMTSAEDFRECLTRRAENEDDKFTKLENLQLEFNKGIEEIGDPMYAYLRYGYHMLPELEQAMKTLMETLHDLVITQDKGQDLFSDLVSFRIPILGGRLDLFNQFKVVLQSVFNMKKLQYLGLHFIHPFKMKETERGDMFAFEYNIDDIESIMMQFLQSLMASTTPLTSLQLQRYAISPDILSAWTEYTKSPAAQSIQHLELDHTVNMLARNPFEDDNIYRHAECDELEIEFMNSLVNLPSLTSLDYKSVTIHRFIVDAMNSLWHREGSLLNRMGAHQTRLEWRNAPNSFEWRRVGSS